MRVRSYKEGTFEYNSNSDVNSLYLNEDVIIVVDPSKSNMAVLVGDLRGNVKDVYELSGNDKKFYHRPMDTTVYTIQVEDFLMKLTQNLNVVKVYAEQHIIPKKAGGKFNYNVVTALTEVRTALTRFAIKKTGEALVEVNNKAWKTVILPEGYRGNDEKGSLRYWRERNPKVFLNATDDVTDAYSIYLYVLHTIIGSTVPKVSRIENQQYQYSMRITDIDNIEGTGFVEFQFDNTKSLTDNCNYISNREEMGFAKIKDSDITPEQLYTYALDVESDSELCIVVKRK